MFLIYPTLDLYLYDLRNGLGQDPKELTDNQIFFANKLPRTIRESVFEKNPAFEAEIVELLGHDKQIELFYSCTHNYKGYFYPVRLNNIYGLLLGCSVSNESSAHPPDCLTHLKGIIRRKLKSQTATIGQTWMISGFLPTDVVTTPEAIKNTAKSWYKALQLTDADEERDLQGESDFFGGKLFEFSHYRLMLSEKSEKLVEESTSLEKLHSNNHVMIAIYPDRDTAEKAASLLITEWIQLFGYRNKILWAYAQSRKLKQQIAIKFVCIQKHVKEFQPKVRKQLSLKALEEYLMEAEKISFEYTNDLRYFEYQKSTIEINIYNYEQQIEKIRIQSHLSATKTTKLKLLDNFSRDVNNRYLKQLKHDHTNFKTGLKLLNEPIDLIRAIVEVRQAEQEWKFQQGITYVGWGFAAGSLVATISSLFPTVATPFEQKSKVDAASTNNLVNSTLSHIGVPAPWIAPVISGLWSTLAFLLVVLLIKARTEIIKARTEKE